MTTSFGTRDAKSPGRGPFRPPPPDVLRQLEPIRRHGSRETPAPTAIFYDLDLSGVDLGGENLAGGTFIDANLSGARLDGANIRRSMAGGIVLRGASCCGTDFFKTELTEADFTAVLGRGIYFAKAILHDARLDDGDFWHGDFNEASCHGASFVGADLSLCDFRNASLVAADLRGVQFGWTDLTGAFLDSNTRLAGAKNIEHGVTATMIRFEGEAIVGDSAMNLLVQLALQPTDP